MAGRDGVVVVHHDAIPRAWRGPGEPESRPIASLSWAQLQSLDEESLHRLRIDIKKMRYAVEFLGSIYPRRQVKSFTGALEAIQETLGELNDEATARELVAMQPRQPVHTIGERQRRLALSRVDRAAEPAPPSAGSRHAAA